MDWYGVTKNGYTTAAAKAKLVQTPHLAQANICPKNQDYFGWAVEKSLVTLLNSDIYPLIEDAGDYEAPPWVDRFGQRLANATFASIAIDARSF